MSFERRLLLLKLTGFITGEISKNEIYEWALFVAVSSDYESLVKSDHLSEQVIQFLLDINKPRTIEIPTKKIIEYFIGCLDGKEVFSDEKYKALFLEQKSKPATLKVEKVVSQNPVFVVKNVSPKTSENEKAHRSSWVSRIARVYVFLFVALSLVLHVAVILYPDFMIREGEIAPPVGEVLRDAFPHLFYGIVVILALFWKAPRLLFYGFFFVAIWGMLFYWYSLTVFINDRQWPFYYLFVVSPVLTIPPTLMFCIMLGRWFDLMKPQDDVSC